MLSPARGYRHLEFHTCLTCQFHPNKNFAVFSVSGKSPLYVQSGKKKILASSAEDFYLHSNRPTRCSESSRTKANLGTAALARPLLLRSSPVDRDGKRPRHPVHQLVDVAVIVLTAKLLGTVRGDLTVHERLPRDHADVGHDLPVAEPGEGVEHQELRLCASPPAAVALVRRRLLPLGADEVRVGCISSGPAAGLGRFVAFILGVSSCAAGAPVGVWWRGQLILLLRTLRVGSALGRSRRFTHGCLVYWDWLIAVTAGTGDLMLGHNIHQRTHHGQYLFTFAF